MSVDSLRNRGKMMNRRGAEDAEEGKKKEIEKESRKAGKDQALHSPAFLLSFFK